jgi:hypothetical protein
MTKLSRLAMAAALCGASLDGVAGAQEFSSRPDAVASRDLMGRGEVEGSGMALRFTMPFGETAVRRGSEPELSLQMFHGNSDGLRRVDVLSYSFAGGKDALRSPLAFQGGAEGGGGFFANPMNWLWIGLGAVGVYLIAEELDDDEEEVVDPCASPTSEDLRPASTDLRPQRC